MGALDCALEFLCGFQIFFCWWTDIKRGCTALPRSHVLRKHGGTKGEVRTSVFKSSTMKITDARWQLRLIQMQD